MKEDAATTTQAEPKDESKKEKAENEQMKNDENKEQQGETKEEELATKEYELLFCGSTKWDLIGRKSVPKAVQNRGGSDIGEEILSPTRFKFAGLPSLKLSGVYTGCAAAHLVLVDNERKAYGMGRNDTGQLGKEDLKSRRHPVRFKLKMKEGEGIVHAACGRGHTMVVTSMGRVFGVGNNACGQLGIGSKTELKKPEVVEWGQAILPKDEKATSVGAGGDFSVVGCESGNVYCMGSGQYGQLGNGRTGECITSANRIAFDIITKPVKVEFGDVKIVQIACGVSHSLALDDQGKVWSWGFGGYGRLGHKTPSDELKPRKVDTFGSPIYKLDLVACGQSASFAVQRNRKSVYMWGVTKRTGESNMYPKPIFELQGWEIRSLGCGATSTVVATETSVISWGGSPTFGELGFGDGPKSSTKPKPISAVEGVQVETIAEGMAFTLMLIRKDVKEEEQLVGQLAQVVLEDEEGVGEEEDEVEKEEEKSKAKGKSKGKSSKRKSTNGANGQSKAKTKKRRR